MANQCAHGDMIRREGDSERGHWVGHFCPLKKGDPNQCSPQWEKTERKAAGGSASSNVATREMTELLQAININLAEIKSLLDAMRIEAKVARQQSPDGIDASKIPF